MGISGSKNFILYFPDFSQNNHSRARVYSSCRFPLAHHGYRPHRCIMQPYIRLVQSGFDCKGIVCLTHLQMASYIFEGGYKLLCKDDNFNLGGSQNKDLSDPKNMAGANYSMTSSAYRSNAGVEYHVPFPGAYLRIESSSSALGSRKSEVEKIAKTALRYLCDARMRESTPRYCKLSGF